MEEKMNFKEKLDDLGVPVKAIKYLEAAYLVILMKNKEFTNREFLSFILKGCFKKFSMSDSKFCKAMEDQYDNDILEFIINKAILVLEKSCKTHELCENRSCKDCVLGDFLEWDSKEDLKDIFDIEFKESSIHA